jgi:DNA polymerase I-like protein with 3'-5' exonuclease and polymerase domains
VAYIDYCQQEFGIAAYLSEDRAMIEAYESSDPYLTFGIQAGLLPPDATKETHGAVREQLKACVLGVQYGMGARSLALKIGQTRFHADELLRLHQTTYHRFWKWMEGVLDYALLHRRLHTVFGWVVRLDDHPNPRSIRNFLMQANGAEMLRVACCYTTERGVSVCAPIHDAILIEAPLDQLNEAVKTAQQAMEDASAAILGGPRLRTDVQLIRYPDRYADHRGEMWRTVMTILHRLRAVETYRDRYGNAV